MPYQVDDTKKIESIQAIFTRMVCRKLNIKYDSYKHCSSFLNLDALEIRRINFNLIIIFKMIHRLVKLQRDTFFPISPSLKLYQLRRQTFSKPISPSTLIRTKFFSCSKIRNQALSCKNHSYCSSRSWTVLILLILSSLNCDFFLFCILSTFYMIVNLCMFEW